MLAKEYGVSKAMIFRIARRGYEPKRPDIRRNLGLPAMVPAPVCDECGALHLQKNCPNKRPKYQDWFAYPKNKLLELLKNRVEIR